MKKTKKEPSVFNTPREAHFYEPYIVDFAIGKDATGTICLEYDGLKAICKEFLLREYKLYKKTERGLGRETLVFNDWIKDIIS